MDGLHFSPSREEFLSLATRGNLVPVYAEVLADLETPVSAFHKLTRGCPDQEAFLLESVEGGEAMARHSFLGVGSRGSFRLQGDRIVITQGGATREVEPTPGHDPLHALQEWLGQFTYVALPGLPRFCGGAVGYLGWDLVRFFEHLPSPPPDDRQLPDCHLLLTDTVLIFDAVRHSVMVLNSAHIEGDPGAAYDRATDAIARVLEQLNGAAATGGVIPVTPQLQEPGMESTFPREGFEAAVERCREYIRAGDCIQIVLSQRFATPLQGDPFEVYRALRHISPAPYMFFLQLGELQLIGASPEILVTEEDRLVRTRPLAGTRPRGATREEDLQLEADLVADPKERAEHIMLVDLGRNDLGRVCQWGSVQVNELMKVERYSHVMHLASDVTGRLRPECTGFDVLRAAFPAGTLSGAPKVRAMEIIDELEPVRRGPYGGAIGYFSFSGNLDTCITLRTIVASGGTAYIQAGAGIVADSSPADEWQETRNKARAALRALAMAASTRRPA